MDCQYGPSLPDRPRWYYDENASTSSVRLQEAMIDVEEKETERLEGAGGGHGRRTGSVLDDESVPGSCQPKTQGAARRPNTRFPITPWRLLRTLCTAPRPTWCGAPSGSPSEGGMR